MSMVLLDDHKKDLKELHSVEKNWLVGNASSFSCLLNHNSADSLSTFLTVSSGHGEHLRQIIQRNEREIVALSSKLVEDLAIGGVVVLENGHAFGNLEGKYNLSTNNP